MNDTDRTFILTLSPLAVVSYAATREQCQARETE
jgi:hypothetical protein